MGALKRLACRMAFAAGVMCIAVAPVLATDFTDLWWNPNESGWGLNVAHQADTVYLTFYVYAADGKPTWFVALAPYSGQTASGALIYTGDLYVTTGPYFGGPFVPSAVTTRRAGTATFRADTVNTATLTYSVDGIPVTKSVERYAFKNFELTGNYLGAVIETDAAASIRLSMGSLHLLATSTGQVPRLL